MPSLHDFWFLSGDVLKGVREGAALFFVRIFTSTFIVAMPAFANWKPIAIALLIIIQRVSADNVEASSNQPRDFPLMDSPQPSSLTSPDNAASLLAFKYDWGTDDLTQQVPHQHLDDPDSLLVANENNHCQSPADQSQTTWRKKRARLRRDDATGNFCAIDSQKIQSGVPVGQQPPTQQQQTQETDGQKPVTGELKGKQPYTPRRGGTIPSSWTEFGQDVENGIIKMGQPDEKICAKPNRKTPVCYIGYPPISRDVIIILPQVRAGELTFQFPDPQIPAHHFRHPK